MAALALYYPVRPHRETRAWGVSDALYQEFGFTRHNGIDLALAAGQEIRAPMDCRVTKVGMEPLGSGLFVSLLSTAPYDFPDGIRARVEITFLHCAEILVTKGMRLPVGTLVAHGGSTGRSTGPHTHMAPKRVSLTLLGYRDRDRNDAANTFDPAPYWNGRYA